MAGCFSSRKQHHASDVAYLGDPHRPPQGVIIVVVRSVIRSGLELEVGGIRGIPARKAPEKRQTQAEEEGQRGSSRRRATAYGSAVRATSILHEDTNLGKARRQTARGTRKERGQGGRDGRARPSWMGSTWMGSTWAGSRIESDTSGSGRWQSPKISRTAEADQQFVLERKFRVNPCNGVRIRTRRNSPGIGRNSLPSMDIRKKE